MDSKTSGIQLSQNSGSPMIIDFLEVMGGYGNSETKTRYLGSSSSFSDFSVPGGAWNATPRSLPSLERKIRSRTHA